MQNAIKYFEKVMLIVRGKGGEGDIIIFECWCFMFYDGPTRETKIIIKCGVFMLCK